MEQKTSPPLLKQLQAGRWWLLPVILLLKKVEIRRITVQTNGSNLGKNILTKGLMEWNSSRCRP
jgi:hypothetical protein